MSKPVTPLLAADAIIELADRLGRPIVLIERRYPPHGWAIPGGFVDLGERLEQAAMREALEETALRVTLRALLGLYSDPQRDPRGHTVTAVYVAEVLITMENFPGIRGNQHGIFSTPERCHSLAFCRSNLG